MKLLYVGNGTLQQSIADVLNCTRGDHEVFSANSKESLASALERHKVDVLLFDDGFSGNCSLAQAMVYARAFKLQAIVLTSVSADTAVEALLVAGVHGYIFREHIGQLPFIISGMAENVQLEKETQELHQALERTTDHYQTLLKHIDDFVFLFDEKGDLVYLSPSAHQLTGFTNLEEKKLFEYIYPEDRKKFFYIFKKILKKPDARIDAHFRIQHKAGHYIWIEGCITNLVKNDAIGAFVLSCRDVTGRTEMERALIRINRLYASIGQINRAILSVQDEQALLKELCYIATEFGNFKAAFVSVLDIATGRLKLIQSSGLAEPDVEPSMVVKDLERAPFDSVLQTGKSFVCNDVQNDLHGEYWKYVAQQKGFSSFIVLPISRAGRIIGVFVLAASAIDSFSHKEIELLEETADDISFKIDILKKDKARVTQQAKAVSQQVTNWA
jgi:PAS domain S-box-containing protein